MLHEIKLAIVLIIQRGGVSVPFGRFPNVKEKQLCWIYHVNYCTTNISTSSQCVCLAAISGQRQMMGRQTCSYREQDHRNSESDGHQDGQPHTQDQSVQRVDLTVGVEELCFSVSCTHTQTHSDIKPVISLSSHLLCFTADWKRCFSHRRRSDSQIWQWRNTWWTCRGWKHCQ